MKVLQVKQYHSEVARAKEIKALEAWKETGYGYPSPAMFHFYTENHRGEPTELRQNGYVAFGDNKVCFGMSREKAIANYIA